MKFQPIVPMIWTNELQETIDFYVNNLGFECGNYNEEWGWAALHKDAAELMIAKPNAHTPFDKPTYTGTFYIKTDNVNELWEKLKDKVKIVYPLEEFEWQMREFAIYDNNGYTIQFGEDISE